MAGRCGQGDPVFGKVWSVLQALLGAGDGQNLPPRLPSSRVLKQEHRFRRVVPPPPRGAEPIPPPPLHGFTVPPCLLPRRGVEGQGSLSHQLEPLCAPSPKPPQWFGVAGARGDPSLPRRPPPSGLPGPRTVTPRHTLGVWGLLGRPARDPRVASPLQGWSLSAG